MVSNFYLSGKSVTFTKCVCVMYEVISIYSYHSSKIDTTQSQTALVLVTSVVLLENRHAKPFLASMHLTCVTFSGR